MRTIQMIMLIIFSAVITFGCADKPGKTPEKVNAVNNKEVPAPEINNKPKSKAPDFKLKSTDGKEVKLSDYKGKVVVIDFWATWCGPCRQGVPDLVELQNEFKNKIVVLGISLDELSGTSSDLKPFMEKFKINYPVLLGTEQLTKDYGDIQSIPTSFIIDQKGEIINRHLGLTPKEEYVKQIKMLLGKS